MENKNKAPAPQLVEAEVPPDIGPNTFGHSTVNSAMQAAEDRINAGQASDIVETASRISESKKLPEKPGSLRHKIGQRIGNLMTNEEIQVVYEADDIEERELVQRFETGADKKEAQTRKTLVDAREHLRGLSSEQSKLLDEYCKAAVPGFLKDVKAKGEATPDQRWSTWLSEGATEDQLLNFLQWHVDTIAKQQQNPEIKAEITRKLYSYKSGLRRGVSEGWLDPDALEGMSSVDHVKVYVGDVFDTLLQEQGGYHIRGSDHIVVAGAFNPSMGEQTDQAEVKNNLQHAANHEYNHAVLDGFGGITWFNEAFTEHIALAMKHGQSEEMHPAKRFQNNGAYPGRRELVATLLSEGRRKIPVELGTRAYSSNKDRSTDTVVEFETALEESWGHLKANPEDSVVLLLNKHVKELERRFTHTGFTYMDAQEHAAQIARSDLLQRPDIIFDKPYIPDIMRSKQEVLDAA